uniref:Integrator complex subunit 9 homolog (Trinotate prediction) n=1 Tax=Myxobolus squamalis TaxID=59785 RepID=A0A6B2G0V1_MYXSQ
MSLTNISSSKKYPCYLLEINDVKIMLDCGLNYNNIRRFESGLWLKIPHFNTIEVSSIDAVLITNYENIVALPFLTEMDGFRAKIYCSQPTMEFGRLLMLDMALSMDESSKTIFDFEPKYDKYLKKN